MCAFLDGAMFGGHYGEKILTIDAPVLKLRFFENILVSELIFIVFLCYCLKSNFPPKTI